MSATSMDATSGNRGTNKKAAPACERPSTVALPIAYVVNYHARPR